MDTELLLEDSDLCHEFHIKLTKETVNTIFVVREFPVERKLKDENQSETEIRTLKHFHFTNWPDFGVPEVNQNQIYLL